MAMLGRALKWVAIGVFWIVVFRIFFYLQGMALEPHSAGVNYTRAGMIYVVGFVLLVALILWLYTKFAGGRKIQSR